MTALLRLGPVGEERPALLVGDRLLDLSSLTDDIDGAFLASGGIARAIAAAPGLLELPGGDGLRVGAPVARPGAVLCIGQNYAAHAAESGSVPPDRPMLFFKHPGSITGPDDGIVLPPGAAQVDWEAELGVVVGTAAWQVAEEDALSHVAGYLVGNDVSERIWQRQHGGGQFGKGKSAPTFCPLGPWLVPADEVEPQSLRVSSHVNGEPRQDSTTADMIFSVAAIIADLSRYLRLEPGDVILTGTPQGVAMSGRHPFLAAGDVVEIGVEGLGVQRSTVRTA